MCSLMLIVKSLVDRSLNQLSPSLLHYVVFVNIILSYILSTEVIFANNCQMLIDNTYINCYNTTMNLDLLEQLGLNTAQAKAYLTLITKGAQTPPKLAERIEESRTNAYMVLERLEELGLVEQVPSKKQLTYQANNPIALEKLSQQKRQELTEVEQKVKTSMPALLSYFYTYSEKPGIRFFEGVDGVTSINNDILRTGQDIKIVRSPSASLTKTTGDPKARDKFIAKRVKLGIRAQAITPTPPRQDGRDERQLYTRHFIGENRYSAPVEITIYGQKVALISYGEEVMGMIIDSPQIAEAFNQMFDIMSSAKVEVTD